MLKQLFLLMLTLLTATCSAALEYQDTPMIDVDTIAWQDIELQQPVPPLVHLICKRLAQEPLQDILAWVDQQGALPASIKLQIAHYWLTHIKQLLMPAHRIGIFNQPASQYPGYITCLAFNQDNTTLASGSADGTITLWNTALQQLICATPLTPPNDTRYNKTIALDIALSQNGKTLICGQNDGAIKCWNIATPLECIATLDSTNGGHRSRVNCIALSNDNKILISGCFEGIVKVWDVTTKQPACSATFNTNDTTTFPCCICSLALSQDNKTVIAGSTDGTINVVDLTIPQQPICIATFNRTSGGHTDLVRCLALHQNGTILASGDTTGTIKLCNISNASLTCIETLDSSTTGHTHGVNCLAISPDAKILFSGGRDESIKIWNIENQRLICIATLDSTNGGHTDWVRCLALSQNGKILASGSSDSTIRLWNIPALLFCAQLSTSPTTYTELIAQDAALRQLNATDVPMADAENA